MSDDSKTLWCGNLSDQVTQELIYELFLQAGPLQQVSIPRDKNGRNKNFAFVTFNHEVSVPYAIHLFRGTALFHKTLSLKPRGRMVDLPPPIRCTTIDPTFTWSQENIKEQFENMTENLNFENGGAHNEEIEGDNSFDKLSVASLQGNWQHRHHPYMDERRRRDRVDQHRHNRDRDIHRRNDRHERSNGDRSERHRDHNDWRQRGFRNRNMRGRY